MTIKIDFETAVNLLNRAVQEKGADYVYDGTSTSTLCVFFDETTHAPACIVGHVFSYLGVANEFTENDHNTLGLGALCDRGIVEVDNETRLLLSEAQWHQDRGKTWGKVLVLALEAVETERNSNV